MIYGYLRVSSDEQDVNSQNPILVPLDRKTKNKYYKQPCNIEITT